MGILSDLFDFVVETVVDVVDTAISWIVPQPEIPDFGDLQVDKNAKGVLVNKFSANASIPVIYGTRKIGGNVVFLETSGDTNQYLYMAVVMSEGEISGINEIHINDTLVTWSASITDNTQITVNSSDANFFSGSSLITCEPHFGTDTQSASTLLSELDSWTSDHQLKGLSYLALKFTWNPDKFGSLPTVQAVVKGKKVYNPNLDSTVTGGSGSHRANDSSTWEYSDNPIYQLLDYLRNDRFGMGISNSYFDSNFADWQTAGDVCDTDITPFSGATAIDLIDSHTIVDTSKKAIDNVKDFVRGARSYLNFSAGKYKILVETTGTASIALSEDNIIGGITVISKNKNSRYNRVIVSFINPDKNYQSDTAQFPPVDETGLASADRFATMKTADGGLLLEGRFDFSMLTSPYQAQEMAEIILRRSRSSLDITFRADATALELTIGDIVNITHQTGGFSLKPFRVQNLSINADQTINVQLSEHQESYYTFGIQQPVPEIPDTNLPNPFNVKAPNITVFDELRALNQQAITILIVDVTVDDEFVVDIEVQAKKTTDTNYINLGKASGNRFELHQVQDGATYDVRARSISLISRSDFTVTQHQIVGKTTPPSDVTNFSVNVVHDQVHLSWTPVTDLDLSHYVIRHSPLTSNANYANATTVLEKVSRPANTAVTTAQTGTYFIKAVDKIDLASTNPTSQVVLVNRIRDLNTVVTSTQNPSFSGTKTNMAVVDNKLVLDTTLVFDSKTGNFDDGKGLFDGGGGTVASSGTYEFDTYLDTSAVYTANLLSSITATRKEYVQLFDDTLGNFDDRQGNFDGDAQVQDDVDTQLLFAKTNDNPAITVESGLTLTDTFSANTSIATTEYERGQPVVFACEVVFPRVVDTACTLWEHGGAGHGASIGFHDTNTFRCAFGRGNNDLPTNDKTIIDISKTLLPTDGQLHTLVWEMIPTNGSGRVFVDDVLVGSASANPSWNNTIWAGTDAGGFISQLNADSPAYTVIRAIDGGSEPNVRWKYGFSGGLRHYQNQNITASLPTYTEFRKFDVSDVTGRAFKFKLQMTSTDAEATHEISDLSATIAMSDRTFAEGNIASWGNQVNYSEEFDNAFWVKAGTTITANQIANPINGQVTADLLTKSVASAYQRVYVNATGSVLNNSTGTYSISIFAKANATNILRLVLGANDLSFWAQSHIDLSNGSLTSGNNIGNSGSGQLSNYQQLTTVSYDNGWYRFGYTVDVNNTDHDFYIWIEPDIGGQSNLGSVYIWGVQLQQTNIMPDYESYSNSTGTKTITYPNAFKESQGIGISSSNLATGDFYAITNESATGFTIQFKNSAGNGVGRRFDYVTKGYGELTT